MKRKSLKCEECKLDFEVYSTYYSHMKLKHKEPSVSCFHCGEKFSTVSARNHHYYIFASRQVGSVPMPVIEIESQGIRYQVKDVQRSTLSNYFVDLNQ